MTYSTPILKSFEISCVISPDKLVSSLQHRANIIDLILWFEMFSSSMTAKEVTLYRVSKDEVTSFTTEDH